MKKFKKFTPLLLILMLVVIIILERLNTPFSDINRNDEKAQLSIIQKKSPKVFGYIRQNLPRIISENGIPKTIKLTQEAFKEELITMYQCHTLSHMVGHFSRESVANNLHTLIKTGIDYCEGGFKHGLQAEIALQGLRKGTDFRPELYSFCAELLKVHSNDCYHGAGHEFMKETMDTKKALDLCDTLDQGPVKSVTDCYSGVFSELTNIVGGLDGETGYNLGSVPLQLQLQTSPIEFCSTLEEKHQIPCALELTGYQNATHSSPEALEQSLLKCVDKKYKEKLQAACLQSVAAVSTQHYLPNQKTMTPPKAILALSPNLQKAYILGAGGEMSEFIKNGQEKDWHAFCGSFSTEQNSFCLQLFQARI